ncbi:Rv3654c family TadE-like protein [Buchananella hordeovulneris]|uniref:Rv3654c family TadE-like protein n=1 Tax=Buchananella hordeovulneris TaxID=52770 RepID=UPI0026DAA8F7|nr:Rv3654c family TadE-like protein [Buchananella hordeovulneris]MDO5081759.1 pilus assembly protein TadG-related protein [Buchananella hordeovulneris]
MTGPHQLDPAPPTKLAPANPARRSGSATKETPRGGTNCRSRDRGSATVAGLGIAALALALAWLILALGAAQMARTTAQRAADLAALAAATALHSDGSACAVAAQVVAANAAGLAACTVEEEDVVVRTVVTAPLGVGQARAVARAGPR